MTQLAAGSYYIVNRVNSFDLGQQLAMNFNGDGNVVTATQWSQEPSQVWTVDDFDQNTQTISPQGFPDLQIGMGDEVLEIYSALGLVWAIAQIEPGIWTVQDGGLTVFWDLQNVIADEPVYFDAGNGSEEQNWLFIAV